MKERTESNYQDNFRFDFYMNHKEKILNRHNSISSQNSTQAPCVGVARGIREVIPAPGLPRGYVRERTAYKKFSEEKVKNAKGELDSCGGRFFSYSKFDNQGNILVQRTHNNGKVHSFEDRPACVKYNESGAIIMKEWKENGKWLQRDNEQPNLVECENGRTKNRWISKRCRILPVPKGFVADNESKQQENIFNNQAASAAPTSHTPPPEIVKIQIDATASMLELFKRTGDPDAFYKIVDYMSSIESYMGFYSGESTTPFSQPSLH